MGVVNVFEVVNVEDQQVQQRAILVTPVLFELDEE